MWQVVLSNVSVQGKAVHSNVYGFCDGSSHVVPLPAYNSKVLHCCYVATVILMTKMVIVPSDGLYISYQMF